MADEILVKESLSDEMIAAGAALTKALEHARWPLVASFWLYQPETNEWWLVLASPVVGEQGPREAYRQVSEVLRATSPAIPLQSVSVVSSNDPDVRVLQSAYRTGRDPERNPMFRGAIDGHFVDDAYVYRILPVAPAA